MKPPTTFMVAKITAIRPRYDPTPPPIFVEIMAPTMAIPEIALDPLIRGVWRVGGTLVIISNPTKMANMKTVSIFISIKYLIRLMLFASAHELSYPGG